MSLFSPTTKSQRGFSLIEVMMALGSLAVLMMGATFLLNFFYTKSQGMTSQTSSRFDLAVLETYLMRDLAGAQPTIGNIIKPAADGTNFFELYADTPFTAIPTAQQTKTFVMDSSAIATIEFIVEHSKTETKYFFQPTNAYTFNPPLAFRSVNQVVPPRTQGFFTQYYASQIAAGSHFYFYSPAELKIPSTNIYTPTREYGFLGYFSGSSLVQDNIGATYNVVHPLLPNVNINDIDNYFRYCPSLGGAMCTLIVMPVDVVRYQLRPDPQNPGYAKLYRAAKIGVTYQGETMIGTDIRRITFLRPNVTTPLIQFDVELKR
jgi:prepilin-type N-terminal cleavage/methylation domain-containing protein